MGSRPPRRPEPSWVATPSQEKHLHTKIYESNRLNPAKETTQTRLETLGVATHQQPPSYPTVTHQVPNIYPPITHPFTKDESNIIRIKSIESGKENDANITRDLGGRDPPVSS